MIGLSGRVRSKASSITRRPACALRYLQEFAPGQFTQRDAHELAATCYFEDRVQQAIEVTVDGSFQIRHHFLLSSSITRAWMRALMRCLLRAVLRSHVEGVPSIFSDDASHAVSRQ
jgi:hypothetical protein